MSKTHISQSGNVFGGFNPDSWSVGPKFFGQSTCFLFHLWPRCSSYETTRFNSNYAYFNLKQKTMPNGMGMGGQVQTVSSPRCFIPSKSAMRTF